LRNAYTYTLDTIAEITGGSLSGHAGEEVLYLATDSRSLPQAEHVLFIAIKGRHHDGNQYIGEAYAMGVRMFMVSSAPDPSAYPGAGFVLVRDSMDALHAVARHRRSIYSGKVIGITGSNGKTIVKEWLYQMMQQKMKVVRSPRSFNSQLGVPLSLWMLSGRFQTGIIEAGISMPGEMMKLEDLIAPDTGILTNIGPAHREGFASDAEKLKEKLKLFERASTLIFRSDREVDGVPITRYLSHLRARKVSWSLSGNATYSFSFTKANGTARLHLKEIGEAFPLPFGDPASLENICHVVVCLLEEGFDPGWIRQHLADLEPVEMRLQILKGVHGTTLVSDVYNSDLAGLDSALDVLTQQRSHSGSAVILSDVYQSGMPPEELYGEVSSKLEFRKVDTLIGIGEEMSRHAAMFGAGAMFFPSVHAFLDRFNPSMLEGHAILIKGSRKFKFEEITRELQLQYHKTVLEIDVNALVDNLNYFRSLLRKETRIMVMVKALAYGSGAHEVAGILQHQKVDYLAVAYPDEGVRLRRSGVTLPVMVMNADPSEYQQLIDFRLEPELYSREGLIRFIRACEFGGVNAYPVHIKLDTGMHRLGFGEEDIDWLKAMCSAAEIRIRSVFSHLAGSDEEALDAFTGEQISRFIKMSEALEDATGYSFMRHILNSAGIVRFPDAQLEMVRLGIGLYGAGVGKDLKTVSTFRTVISQIRRVPAGETVGYSRRGSVERDAVIATIPVGYADGIDRHLGNGRYRFLVNGEEAPTIGNICMDMTMLDITGIDATVGDPVELFGKNCPVERMADILGTIVYEIFTGIPERVKRVYIRE
jgi:alanine racemase